MHATEISALDLRSPHADAPGWRRARRLLLRGALALGAFLVVATVFIGFLHTRAGHPFLMRLAGAAGCPMGGASAARVEAVRSAALANGRGSVSAPLRPALGFVLDKTTLADVRAWEARVGVDCSEQREGTLVSCADVPSSAVGRPALEGTLAELSFGFSPRGGLVSVTTLYSHRASQETARIASEVEATLAQELGQAHTIAGSFTLAGSTATRAYRFRDYAADLTSSRVPGSGYAVREQYASML